MTTTLTETNLQKATVIEAESETTFQQSIDNAGENLMRMRESATEIRCRIVAFDLLIQYREKGLNPCDNPSGFIELMEIEYNQRKKY
jgi:hypothetical protein